MPTNVSAITEDELDALFECILDAIYKKHGGALISAGRVPSDAYGLGMQMTFVFRRAKEDSSAKKRVAKPVMDQPTQVAKH